MDWAVKNSKLTDKNFPPLLKEIPGAPERIFHIGRLPEVAELTIAVVGTRKATSEGVRLAKEIGRDLARAGATVVSGLALGIDSAAHAGTLLAGGRAVAVLGNGLNQVYPAQNQNLAEKILGAGGALVSEYPEGAPSLPHQFLERNRIISGLSHAVVVIEAPIRSGSLSTARHALEQGREVFVVPGPAGHPNYGGSHMLLREGARLVTNAEEILEDLKSSISNFEFLISKPEPPETKIINDEAQLLIFKTIQATGKPLHIDNIVEITKLEPNIINQKLTSLMLEGLIEERNGKFRAK
jgi:DNA processing protein